MTYFDPHGYFFVSLPDGVSRRPLHDIPHRGPSADTALLSGVLTCQLVALTPIHIGSGSYRQAPDALQVLGGVLADVVRDAQGKPLIPGSSLKGGFRAIAEAASRSCLRLKQNRYKEDFTKLPDQIKQRNRQSNQSIPEEIDVEVDTDKDFESCTINARMPEQSLLCPCCALFGTLGYRGRITFTDALMFDKFKARNNSVLPQWRPIPARNSPQPHRLVDKATWAGDPANQSQVGGLDVQGDKLISKHPLGRKFYPNWDPHEHFGSKHYDWSQIRRGYPNGVSLNHDFFEHMRQRYGSGRQAPALYCRRDFQFGEPHDVIPVGDILRFRLHFQALLPWELGLLLFGMGVLQPWLPKLGGGKAYGLGSVKVRPSSLILTQQTFTSYQGGEVSIRDNALAQWLNERLNDFLADESRCQTGIEELVTGFSLDLQAEFNTIPRRLWVADNAIPMRS